jgi:hypothetical protein
MQPRAADAAPLVTDGEIRSLEKPIADLARVPDHERLTARRTSDNSARAR